MKRNFTIKKGNFISKFILTSIFLICLGSFAKAQNMMPIPGHDRTYTGSVRGYWFQAPADFVITGLRVVTSSSSASQHVWVGKLSNPPANCCPASSSHTQLFYQNNVAGSGIVAVPDVYVEEGDYILVLGARGTNSTNSYSSPVAAYSTTIAGKSTTLQRAGFQGDIHNSAPSSVWGVPTTQSGNLGRVELYWDYPKDGTDNAKVSDISPEYPCAGSNDIKVTVSNAGLNQITSFKVNWSVNGVTQTPVTYNSSTLDTIGGTGTSEVQITLGSHSYINNKRDTIVAWVDTVNNVKDTALGNNTVSIMHKPSLNGTFTVGGVGADYASLQLAFNDLQLNGVCGPVILDVTNGTYNQQVTIPKIQGASSTNTVTVKGNNALFDHDGDASQYAVITFDDAEWVIVDDLRIKNTGNNTYDWGVNFTGNSNNCTLSNCNVSVRDDYNSTRSIAIVLSGSNTSYSRDFTGNNITVQGNTTYGGYYGVTMWSAYGGGSSDNLIKENNIQDFYYIGMYVRGMKQTLIQGNDISRPTRTSITTFYGIYMYNGNTTTTVDGNKIHTNRPAASSNTSTVYAIYAQYEWFSTTDNDNAIINNLIYDIENGSSTQIGIRLDRSYDFLIANNTVVLDDASSTSGTTRGIETGTSTRFNDVIQNNNVYITRGGSSTKHGIYVGGNNSTNKPIVHNNNVFMGGAGTGTMHWGSYLGQNAENAEAYNDLDVDAVDNISVDPAFRDPANVNYEPKDARLNGAGTAVAQVTVDIDGVSRGSSKLDIGAYLMACDFGITAFTLPNSTECEFYTPEIEVTVKNFSAKEYLNIPVGLTIDNAELVRNVASLTLAPSASGNYTYENSYFFENAGNYDIRVFPLDDELASNDTQTFNITILPSPRGAVLTEGANNTGIFRQGNMANFDVARAGDTVEYNVSIPTGGGTFNDVNYGSAWDIPVSVESMSGVTISSAQHAVVAPTSTTDAIVKFTSPEAYTDSILKITIPVRNIANGCDSSIIRYIYIAPIPRPNFEAPDVCDGDGIAFNNISEISDATVLEYEWDFGANPPAPSTNTNPVIKYPTFGVYDVKLTATSVWGYKHDTTIQVTVFESPNISFRPINACEGDAVQFENNTSVSTGTLTYEWDFGDGNGSIVDEPSHTYGSAGEYTVTLTAEVSGCKRALQKSAFQFPQPKAGFTYSGGDCNQQEVEFTNTSSISFGRLGNFWDFGDLVYSTEENTLHTFENSGSQTVKLTVTSEFGCKDSSEQIIDLKASPVADFTNTQTCDIDPVEFTNNSFEPVGVNVDYSWDFGDPTSNDNTSNLTNPEHQYSLPGARKVTLTATADNGCENTVTKDIVVGVQPQAEFSVEDGCEGEPVFFNNETTISRGDIEVTYDWSFGSTDVSPENVFDNAGTYDVTLTATATEGGCTDEITKQVNIGVTPVCDFDVTTTGQLDATFTPTEDDATYTYEWQFGDGGFSTEMNPTYQYTFHHAFQVTLRVITPEGCECSNTVTSTITSTDDIDLAEHVNVYPNPNTGKFTIEVDNNLTEDVDIEVYNSLGAKVAVVGQPVNGKYSVDLGDAAAGIYTVKFTSGESIYTVKITVTE